MKKFLPSPLRRPVRALYHRLRPLLQRCLGPLDAAARRINDKSDFPPLHLRSFVGGLRTFESSGAEFLAYLRLLADLKPDSRFLDIGCGCGLMALNLRDFLAPPGSYVGLDVAAPAIQWCRQHYAGDPLFAFHHVDVANSVYNPRGKGSRDQSSSATIFPVADASCDVVLAKSVFTHLRPAEAQAYLAEVARVLAPGGHALLTFFLMNEAQARWAEQGKSRFDLAHGDEVWRFVDPDRPEGAVAFAESAILEWLHRAGLRLSRPPFYGRWSGRADGLSFQDFLVIEPAQALGAGCGAGSGAVV